MFYWIYNHANGNNNDKDRNRDYYGIADGTTVNSSIINIAATNRFDGDPKAVPMFTDGLIKYVCGLKKWKIVSDKLHTNKKDNITRYNNGFYVQRKGNE